jgi:RNA polymerase sigma-70 factor (ECF subfamily)
MVKVQFEPQTWQAFQRVALEDIPAAQVAQELNISVNAVFIAKSRVLSRLRELGAGLIEE